MSLREVVGTIGAWMRNGDLFTDPTDPPHKMPGEPGTHVSLFPVYFDDERRTVVAVRDWDGCEAMVQSLGAPHDVEPR